MSSERVNSKGEFGDASEPWVTPFQSARFTRFAVFTRYPGLAPPNGVHSVLPAVPDLTASRFPSTLPLLEFFAFASERRVTQWKPALG